MQNIVYFLAVRIGQLLQIVQYSPTIHTEKIENLTFFITGIGSSQIWNK